MISEYKNGKVINRRGEWGENLPPDFGILEDSIYKVIRKKSELTQQGPSKPTKRQKVEVCETVCEAAYESLCESDTTRAKALPTGEITDVGSTQCTENLSVMISTCRYDIQNIDRISDLNSPSKTHISCGNSDKVKIANGKRGLISGYFVTSDRYSGVSQGSSKLADNPKSI